MKTLLIAALLLASTCAARADSIWNYQGNLMSGCNCALSGTVTLDSNNLATSWDFTDGKHDLNSTNSVAHIWAAFRYDIWNPPPAFTGQPFASWLISIATPQGGTFHSEFDPNGPLPGDQIGSDVNGLEAWDSASFPNLFGIEVGNRGTWTDPVSTPEPSTLGLLMFGLIGLSRLRPRK